MTPHAETPCTCARAEDASRYCTCANREGREMRPVMPAEGTWLKWAS